MKPKRKNKSVIAVKGEMQSKATIQKMHDEMVRLGLGPDFVAPIKKRSTRIVGQGIVKSTRFPHQMYPVVLDIQHDGAFSSATYPSRVPSKKLKDVALALCDVNYRTRYGKFTIDFNTREVKFRVFRSAADISNATEASCRILRALPVQMMDQISQTIDGIVAGSKKEVAMVEELIIGTKQIGMVHKKAKKSAQAESAKKQS